jgi:hypothetical protein
MKNIADAVRGSPTMGAEMLELYLYSIALLRSGRYRVVRSTRSGDVLTHAGMDEKQQQSIPEKGRWLAALWKTCGRNWIAWASWSSQ